MKPIVEYLDPFNAKEQADKVLFEFNDIAKKMGVQYFLVAGTCLGFLRDKDYIEGDNDIDVGMKCEAEKRENFFRELQKNGFIKNIIPGARANRNIHLLKNKILIDVFFGGGNVENQYANSFRKIVYNNREFNIFKEAEEYLAHKYGDWKVPIDRKTFLKLKHKGRKK